MYFKWVKWKFDVAKAAVLHGSVSIEPIVQLAAIQWPNVVIGFGWTVIWWLRFLREEARRGAIADALGSPHARRTWRTK